MLQTQLSVNELGSEPLSAESDKMSFVNNQVVIKYPYMLSSSSFEGGLC